MSIQERRVKDLNRAAETGGAAAVIRELVAWERPWGAPDTRELKGIESFCKHLSWIADEVETYNKEEGTK